MKNILTLIILLGTVLTACGAVVDGSTQVKLDIKNPIPAEKTAEQELKHYLNKIFGKAGKKGKSIILRYDSKLGKEAFYLRSDKNGNILISGGRPRGVLFGSYYFLDRKLGVKWLTPNFEAVPKKRSVKIGKLDYRGVPAFNARIMQTERSGNNTLEGRRWRARNLFNSGFGGIYVTDPAYGEELIFSPPAQCHGLFRMVTPAKYYKKYPEMWALQNGKRTSRGKRGVASDYCLTSKRLIDVTVQECKHFLAKNPTARYISIQEGDGTRGYCDCAPCKALVKKHGNRESARWVYFANQVGRKLKKDFPQVKVLIFAYTASRRPPKGIKADDNVCVQLCVWNNRRGLPYNHAKNKSGREFFKQLSEWKKVCKNILIWDYTYGYANLLQQTPDLLNNVENLRAFKKYRIDGYFPENGIPEFIAYAMPLKGWLLPRLMWNPDECDGRALIKEFCQLYFGKKSGKTVADYYLSLCDINAKQKFLNVATGGGVIGRARFLATDVTVKNYLALKKAYDNEKTSVYKKRLYLVLVPVKYQLVRDYPAVRNTGKVKETMEQLITDIRTTIQNDKATPLYSKRKYNKHFNKMLSLKNIQATGSIVYANYFPAQAYDGDIKTQWHAASGAGWCQIEFDNVREIKRITTVFGTRSNILFGENEITGSLDGKKFFPIVPRRKVENKNNLHWTWSDDILAKPVKVKFIRTRMINAYHRPGRKNDVLLYEQYFNLEKLPEELSKKLQ